MWEPSRQIADPSLPHPIAPKADALGTSVAGDGNLRAFRQASLLFLGVLCVSAVKSLQSSCADHQPAKGDLFFHHAGRLPDCGGGRTERQLDHPVLARRSRSFFSAPSFFVIIVGLVLNTIFLVREIRRNEQHDSFINAVTHELKTPIASIRLYLQTLQRREVGEPQRRQFYELMLLDTERLLHTVEQVLKAGEAAQKKSPSSRQPVEFNALVRECMELARVGIICRRPISNIVSLYFCLRLHLHLCRTATERACWAMRRSYGRRFRTCWTMR